MTKEKRKQKTLVFPSTLNMDKLHPNNWAKEQMIEGVSKITLCVLIRKSKGRHPNKGKSLRWLGHIPNDTTFEADFVGNDPDAKGNEYDYRLSGDDRKAYNILVEYATSRVHGLLYDPSEGWVSCESHIDKEFFNDKEAQYIINGINEKKIAA